MFSIGPASSGEILEWVFAVRQSLHDIPRTSLGIKLRKAVMMFGGVTIYFMPASLAVFTQASALKLVESNSLANC